MATEKEYDDIIAPMLADVAKKAEELGMSLVASVEWEPNERGSTLIGPMTSVSQKLVKAATLCHGNIDAMIIGLMRSGVDFSQSAFLHSFSKESASE